MRQEGIPVLLLFVAAHGQHQNHGVVDSLYAAIGARVVRAGVDLVNVKSFVEGKGELRGKLYVVAGGEHEGERSKRYVLVDEDIGGAAGGELGCSHCVHVGTAAEVVGAEKDVGVVAWCKAQRAEVVDAGGDAWAVG